MPARSTLLYRCRACGTHVGVVVDASPAVAIRYLLNRASLPVDGRLDTALVAFGLEAAHDCAVNLGSVGVMDLLCASPVADPDGPTEGAPAIPATRPPAAGPAAA